MSDLNEDDFRLMIQVHPSGTRDFVFYTIADGEAPTPQNFSPDGPLGFGSIGLPSRTVRASATRDVCRYFPLQTPRTVLGVPR